MIYLGNINNEKLRKELLKEGIKEIYDTAANRGDTIITDSKSIMKYDFSNNVNSFIILDPVKKGKTPYTVTDVKIAATFVKEALETTSLTILFGIDGQVDYNIEVTEAGNTDKRVRFKGLEKLYGFEEYGATHIFDYSNSNMNEFLVFIKKSKAHTIRELITAYEREPKKETE